MTTVVSLQSQVCAGHVGNGVAVFALQRLGFEVVALPSAVLSNHNGHPKVGSVPVDGSSLRSMVEALSANGFLDEVDAVLTGYLTPAAVPVAVDLVDRVKALHPAATFLCDPVLGDVGPGQYVPDAVAGALAERLVPRADVLTPNLFELGVLTGTRPRSLPQVVESARRLMAPSGRTGVVVTSVQTPDLAADRAHLVGVGAGRIWHSWTPLVPGQFSGAGDLFAAVLTAQLLAGDELPDATALAAGATHLVLDSTARDGARELAVVRHQDHLVDPAPARTQWLDR